jgi:hypothetical protein
MGILGVDFTPLKHPPSSSIASSVRPISVTANVNKIAISCHQAYGNAARGRPNRG